MSQESETIFQGLLETSDSAMVKAFEGEVRRRQRERGCSKAVAIKSIVKANPALHREYIVATNNLKKRKTSLSRP